MRLPIAVCLSSIAAGYAFVAFALAAPVDDLHALFDDYQANAMAEDPIAATGAGINDYNDQLPSVAPADHARRAAKAAEFLARLEGIDKAALSPADQVNRDILHFILKHKVARAEFRDWRTPFLADSGFHTNINFLASTTPFRTEKDYEDYLKRLEGLPGYIEQHIDNMRLGLADGFTQPQEILAQILPSFDNQVKERAEDHALYMPFEMMPGSIKERRQQKLQKRARRVMNERVLPAFAELARFMHEEYVPGARATLGASEVDNGEAYYAAQVRFYTSLDDATAESVHQLGLKEVARIRAEMDQVIEETGFEGSFDEFIEFLRTDEQFYPKTARELLAQAAWISKDIDGRLPAYFGKLPRQPYAVRPVPAEIAANYTTGRYSGAPLNADRGGEYWVNTYALETRPLYQLIALSLHEAVPGHHLQIALAKEIENVPAFRAGFYPHSYGEGWALYAEKLGVEMGVYPTPYDHFGRLSYEMWRAARLVIDTGIHAKGWTRKQAQDYLASNTALSQHNVRTEVDRYIAWPGQALAYKMGELTIWELRAKAEKELGDKFDIREFHDTILAEGGVPMVMLRERIYAYIEEAKAR